MYGIKNCAPNIFFSSENPKVFYTHSVIVDMVKNVQFLKDRMETTYEISNLI